MSQPGITFEHVWKRFCRTERHRALRDLIPSLVKRAVRAEHELKKHEFWALKDVSLETRRGEALGIIGSNGAGKSTVLKLLTKILRPTEGRCELRGRVGALIEVAAGFHQDLTGRENVSLQGAIMGMKRAEIARKFDQIVEFSGIADFIDMPVRRYSSGMNARLGFAIAAHLEPEVLIVDEVLAVGDFAFQQRAFGRIQEMVNQDVTTIIVSHQLERIASLCKRAVLLRQGEVAHVGPAAETITAYVSGESQGTAGGSTDSPLVIRSAELLTDGRTASGSRIRLRVNAEVVDPARLDETSGVGSPGALDAEREGAFCHHVDASGLVTRGAESFHPRRGPAAQHGSRRLRNRDGRVRPATRPVDCEWPLGECDGARGEELHRRDPDESGDGAAFADSRRRASGAGEGRGAISVMRVSVVLATREREELLARTLASLALCRRPDNFGGTFVVENGKRAGTEDVVREAPAGLDARYLFEPVGNKSRALNAALAQIDDGLIVFLDDDVRVGPGLLEEYAAAARRAGAGHFFGGPVAADYEEAPPDWLIQFLPLSARGWHPDERTLATKPFFLGFNWAVFAGDLRRVGGFSEQFGPGSDSGVGDESDVQRRLAATGLKGVCVPEALVLPLGAAGSMLAGMDAGTRVPQRHSERAVERGRRRHHRRVPARPRQAHRRNLGTFPDAAAEPGARRAVRGRVQVPASTRRAARRAVETQHSRSRAKGRAPCPRRRR